MTATVLHRRLAPDVSIAMLYDALRLRVEVFVVEQHCAYQELDGADLDRDTRHFWLSPRGEPDRVAGYLRLLGRRDGEDYRIGRLCIAPAARGAGAARRLMEAALAEVGEAPCVLDAQSHLVELYVAFGFSATGPEFVEDGIPHVPMRRVRAAVR